MARKGIRNLDRFVADVLDFASIADDFIDRERKDEAVVRALVESAMSGIGPGRKAYAPIKEPYKSRKKREGGNSTRFLWGLRRGGLHMLSRRHFMWRRLGKTAIELVWTATGKTGDYASVHNDGEGKMPKREWMHLNAPATEKAVDDLLGGILENRASDFSRKWS